MRRHVDAVFQHIRLDGTLKMVLLYLAHRADADDRCLLYNAEVMRVPGNR